MITKEFPYPNDQQLASHHKQEIEVLRRLANKHMNNETGISKFEIELTSTLGEALLAHSALLGTFINRHETENRIEEIGRDLKEERWCRSYDPMALGPNLVLGNAYHRTKAVIKTGISMTLDVIVFTDEVQFKNSIKVGDNNKKRTKGDALEMLGIVPRGQGKRAQSILEAVTYVDRRFPLNLTSSEMEDMGRTFQSQLNTILRSLSSREFIAPTCAAFLIAYLKCPSEIETCMRHVSNKIGYTDGSAAHALTQHLPQMQKEFSRLSRHTLVMHVLSYLYKHVKNKKAGVNVRKDEKAYQFFLDGNFRESSGR